MKKSKWEVITDTHDDRSAFGTLTERLRVPGGWIYRTVHDGVNGDESVAMVFVPRKKIGTNSD